MTRLDVHAAPTSHLGYLARKTGCALTSDFNAIEATDGAGRVHGMVGYCNWTRNSVQMHMAVEAPIVWRSLLRPALQYPFAQVGMGLVLGIIPASNLRSIRFASVVGFEEAHRVKDGWAQGDDLLLLQLRREDCRFLFPAHFPARRAA